MKQKTPYVEFNQLPLQQQHSIIARLEREIPDPEMRKYVLANYRAIPEGQPTANILQELKNLSTELNVSVIFSYKSQVIEYKNYY